MSKRLHGLPVAVAMSILLVLSALPPAHAEDPESGDQTERVLAILESSKQNPTTFEDYDKLATIAYAKGEYDSALTYLDACIALLGEGDAGIAAALHTQKGAILRKQEKKDEAMAELNQAAEYAPRSVQMLLARAELSMEEKEYSPAVTDLEAYVELLPEDTEAWALLADAYRGQGQKDKAGEADQRSEALGSDDANAVLTTARRNALYGDLQSAVSGYLQYLEQNEDDKGTAHFLLAGTYMDLGMQEEAIACLQAALALDYPEPGICYEYLSSCYFVLGDYENTLQTGSAAEKSAGEGIGYDTLNQRMGISALSLGRSAEAVEYFTQALAYNADLFGVFYYRGFAYMGDGKMEEAIADLTESIARGELAQRCMYNRGLCYIQTDSLAKGVSDLERAMAMTDEAEIAAAAEEILWQMALQMITTTEE